MGKKDSPQPSPGVRDPSRMGVQVGSSHHPSSRCVPKCPHSLPLMRPLWVPMTPLARPPALLELPTLRTSFPPDVFCEDTLPSRAILGGAGWGLQQSLPAGRCLPVTAPGGPIPAATDQGGGPGTRFLPEGTTLTKLDSPSKKMLADDSQTTTEKGGGSPSVAGA